MFRFTTERMVRDWPARIQVSMDGGKTRTHRITLDLKIIDTDDYRQTAAEGDVALIEKVVHGWGGIGDEQGNDLEFCDENRNALARHPGFVRGAINAYMNAANGEASRKN